MKFFTVIKKKSILPRAFFLLLIIFFFPSFLIYAQDYFTLQKYESITPASIPVFESYGTGASNIGMTTLRFRAIDDVGPNGAAFRVKNITVHFTETGNFDEANDIIAIKVYKDDGNNVYDKIADTVAANNWTGASGPYNFSGGVTKVVDIDTTKSTFDTGWTRLYITYDFSSNADSPAANLNANIMCKVDQIEYEEVGFSTYTEKLETEVPPVTISGLGGDVDDYEVTPQAAGIAPSPAEAEQGAQNVPVLKLTFTAGDGTVSSNGYSTIDSIRLKKAGTGADSDVAAGGVILFDDSGTTAGSFDSGDQEITGSASTLGGVTPGYVTLNPTVNIPVTAAGSVYYVVINIAANAQVGNTIGLELEDPDNDVVFVDPMPTDAYIQGGFINPSATVPVTNNTITIQEITTVDVTPPTVAFTDPTSDKTDVPIGTDITAIFSEKLNESTVTASTFTLKDITGMPVSGTVRGSGERFTFTPSKELDYETKYTATLATGIEDRAGNPMAQEYTWSFTTVPNIPEPVAANNRILPGSTDPVKIYIPQPPGGASEKITVQVYTVKGQRVATLVNNRPYSQIVDELPILWYGKNGRQKNLGPGLYFIQIKTGSYKRVLKVLIVR